MRNTVLLVAAMIPLSACTTLRNLETAYACRDGEATDECVERYTAEYFRQLDEMRREMAKHNKEPLCHR